MEKIIISCLESRVETNRSIYARFLLGPFKDDNAVTIATALRRSLLSKVKSIAITAIHIQGVTHEFSTIVGVRESVLDLALNFQQVVLRTKTDANASQNEVFLHTKAPLLERTDSPQIGYLQMQGPAVIYANDLKFPVGIECVDPTQYIATLSTEGLLVVKFVIGKKKTSFDINNKTLTGKKINVPGCSPKVSMGLLCKSEALLAKLRFARPLKGEALDCKSSAFAKQLRSGDPNKFGFSAASGETKFRTSVQNLPHTKQSFVTQALQNKVLAGQSLRGKKTLTADSHKSHSEGNTKQSFVTRAFDSTTSLRNTIFLDPIFDSVLQVNYIIEKDDLFNQSRERIVLELWTNGSVHPRQALHKASLSLISTFSIFRKVFSTASCKT